jgi:tRNA A-37 threonylcarbamoyl transferase component Bud32/dipeptidyl aminopeptidase/acylaminoacyl peptidase
MKAAHYDLLLGLLALQNGLIDQVQLIAAFQAWTRDKSRSLAEHLVSRGDLDAEQRSGVEAMVALHLKKHGSDIERSLAAIPAGHSTREGLGHLDDPDIQASLLRLGLASPQEVQDPDRTATYSIGTSTSDGLRFGVLRPHARGGLGAVFVALDSELHREVALKQLQDEHADDPLSRHRFLVEAEITASLEHPGIVPVYGLGSYHDGRPYYAMRFIKGDSLKEAITRFHKDPALKADRGKRVLELRNLLRRFVDVCNAIEYAHARGVLHRDIKPGNMIVGKYGETLVVDWGLAKATGRREPSAATGECTLVPSSGSSETLPGQALGTPGYMSPEQARGDLDALGPRSDVYSLGATLYCLLTGKAPFEGEVGEVLGKVQRGEFPRLRELDPALDPPLEAVCLKAMAMNPEDRYDSCRALAEEVERWAADEPVTAYREPWGRRAQRWATRHRTAVTAAAVALVAGLLGLAAVAAVQARAKSTLADKNVALSAANAEVEARALAERREHERFARLYYGAESNLMYRDYEANSFPEVRRRLVALTPSGPDQRDGRGFEWYYMQAACQQGLRVLRGHETWVTSAVFSPDGRRIATASSDRTARIWDASTGRELATLRGHENYVNSAVFSPDGRRIVTASSDRTARIWDAETGRELAALRGHEDMVNSAAFSSDGHRVTTASRDGTARIWDAETGRELATLRGHEDAVHSAAFSPDGRRIATASDDRTARIWDAETGRELASLRGHENGVTSAVFAPDGRRIATASGDNTARIWDASLVTDETRDRRDALSLVRFLLERANSEAALREAIARDQTSSQPVRALALEQAGPFWESHVRQQAEAVLLKRSAQGLLSGEVIAALRDDPSLSPPVKAKALALAQDWRPWADLLNNKSWSVVRLPDRDPAAYRRALQQAEEACRLSPDNGMYLNTLGVAQYRCGLLPEALKTLRRSNKLNKDKQPEDLAFLALAHHRLGQLDEARDSLERFRSLMKDPAITPMNTENRSFFREAEAVILGLPDLPESVFAPGPPRREP